MCSTLWCLSCICQECCGRRDRHVPLACDYNSTYSFSILWYFTPLVRFKNIFNYILKLYFCYAIITIDYIIIAEVGLHRFELNCSPIDSDLSMLLAQPDEQLFGFSAC